MRWTFFIALVLMVAAGALLGGISTAHAAGWDATTTPAATTTGWDATVSSSIPDNSPKSLNEAVDYSKAVYCGARSVLASNLGLMLGLLLAATGLYSMITKGVSAHALATIIAGALLTSLPGLIESLFGGVVGVLGPLTTLTSLNIPSCPGL